LLETKNIIWNFWILLGLLGFVFTLTVTRGIRVKSPLLSRLDNFSHKLVLLTELKLPLSYLEANEYITKAIRASF